jgi:hypothetical protein
MLAWIRRDEALRGWPVWLLVTSLNTSVIAGLLVLRAAERRSPVPAGGLLLAAWIGVALYLAFGRTRTRARPFHLTLPLSARRLWLGHVTAVVLMAGAVALAGVALELAHPRMLAGRVALEVRPLALAAHLLAGAALATVLLQLASPQRARIPLSAGYALWALAVLVAVPALLVFLAPRGAAWSLLTLAAAVAIGGWELATLPPAFSLVPREAARARVALLEAPGADRAPSRWIVAAALFRGASAGALDWMSVPVTMLFAFVVGGGITLLGMDAVDLRYAYVPMLSYLLFSAIAPRLGRLHHLDPLPVPRRILFALLVVPCFAACVAGYGLGAFAAGRAARRAELVGFPATGEVHSVKVPMWARRIAWNGRPPAVVSPWGESHAPVTWPLWRGGRAVLYSPFSAPRGSSREYVAWQLSRAVEAVYGRRVPADEIADRYLVTGADGRVVLRAGARLLSGDDPRLSPVSGGPMFAVLMALVCVPWLLLVALLLRAYRAGVSDAWRQGLFWGLAVLVVVFFAGQAAAVIAGLARPWLATALVEIPVRALGESAAATVGAWVAAAVLLLVAYRLAESQFVRMEIPARPTRFTLIELARSED